jgi:hypothetical protein
LIESGVSFFSGLAQTRSSPEKTQERIQWSRTEKLAVCPTSLYFWDAALAIYGVF